MKKTALISVSDKTGIIQLAGELDKLGYEILATGNTAKLLNENKIKCVEVSKYASFPEIFDGRVKTLQPKIFGGILMRRDNKKDIEEAEKNGVQPIDIVCVNLYPFPKVVKDEKTSLETKIENIDIGGPSLIRAASKNYKHTVTLTSPDQYDDFLFRLKNNQISVDYKAKLAASAFSHTAYYDSLIADFFEKEFETETKSIRINCPLDKKLRYGENPHQEAYIAGNIEEYFDIFYGKEISYNNIIDLTAAVELAQDLGQNGCAIIKHTNPCGAAIGKDGLDAYLKALSADPTSAFGGIVAFNAIVDEAIAEKLNEIFLEIVCAPGFTEGAQSILFQKKNRRLVKVLKTLNDINRQIKSIPGGFLIQQTDQSKIEKKNLQVATKKTPTEKEIEDLLFAAIIAKHAKSNAIVYARDNKILGVGAGQMSRVDSTKIAAFKAKEFGNDLRGAVAASDAFFPFPDGIAEIASHGIVSIIQPGGSVRDNEVIEEANRLNISMVFTGIRNFKH